MKLIKFLDEHLEKMILGVLVGVINVVMLLQIVMRYVFNNSLPWTEELCRYCYIYFMFIGTAFAVKENSHLRVDSLLTALPKAARAILETVVDVVVTALLVFLFAASVRMVVSAYQVGNYSAGLKLPLYLLYLSVPLGFGLTVFRYVQRLVRKLGAKRRNDEEGEGAA